MDVLQAIILGVVEGLTEFLPISSMGHLIVAEAWLGIGQNGAQTAFDIVIQLAAILAVVTNYRDKFTFAHVALWQKVILAFIPIAAAGFLFGDGIEVLFSVEIVATAFIVGGIVFLGVEHYYGKKPSHLGRIEAVSWRQAAWIGIAQVFALVPGTSRAGSTIVGALLVGTDRKASAEFSFLLALPVMIATTGYAIVKHHGEFTAANVLALGVGFVTAFVVACLTMRWFICFLARFTFVAFGVYRIFFGLVLLIWFT